MQREYGVATTADTPLAHSGIVASIRSAFRQDDVQMQLLNFGQRPFIAAAIGRERNRKERKRQKGRRGRKNVKNAAKGKCEKGKCEKNKDLNSNQGL